MKGTYNGNRGHDTRVNFERHWAQKLSRLKGQVATKVDQTEGRFDMPWDPGKVAGSTGFLLQLQAADEIRGLPPTCNCEVFGEEVPWIARDGSTQFIDLIVKRGPALFVIECKRSRDSEWVFLEGTAPSGGKRHDGGTPKVKTLWTCNGGSGFHNIPAKPNSRVADFCCLPGSGTLERIAAVAADSTEAFAETALSEGLLSQQLYFFYPMNVTNLPLRHATFSDLKVNSDGEIDLEQEARDSQESFSAEPWILFRKTLRPLSLGSEKPEPPGRSRMRQLMQLSTRHSFVVQTSRLGEFFRLFEPVEEAFTEKPWNRR